MADMPGQLTLEQQFSLTKLRTEAQVMSDEAVKGLLVQMLEEMMHRDNQIKALIREKG